MWCLERFNRTAQHERQVAAKRVVVIFVFNIHHHCHRQNQYFTIAFYKQKCHIQWNPIHIGNLVYNYANGRVFWDNIFAFGWVRMSRLVAVRPHIIGKITTLVVTYIITSTIYVYIYIYMSSVYDIMFYTHTYIYINECKHHIMRIYIYIYYPFKKNKFLG